MLALTVGKILIFESKTIHSSQRVVLKTVIFETSDFRQAVHTTITIFSKKKKQDML